MSINIFHNSRFPSERPPNYLEKDSKRHGPKTLLPLVHRLQVRDLRNLRLPPLKPRDQQPRDLLHRLRNLRVQLLQARDLIH